MNVGKLLKVARKAAKKHLPKILLGTGIVLGVCATVEAVKATPKALDILDEELERNEPGSGSVPIQQIPKKFTAKDTIKHTWKCYIPAVAMGGAAIGCIVAAGVLDEKKIGALTLAATMSERALQDYVAATVKTVGESKERDIQSTMAQEHLERHPYQENKVVSTGNGETLCMDAYSGRYFRSCREAIGRAVNEANRRMIQGDDELLLNDFYYLLGLDPCDAGDTNGWTVKHPVDISYSSRLVPGTGEPCLVVEYRTLPMPFHA